MDRVAAAPGREPLSYYEASAQPLPSAPPLEGIARADICIVGGGYTGLMAALELAERGFSVRLIEAERIAFGGSGRNGGQLGSGQRRGQRFLESQYGGDVARLLWTMAEDAKALAKRRIGQHAIACALKPGILTAAHKESRAAPLARDIEHLAVRYGYKQTRLVAKDEVAELLGTPVYHGGALDMGGAHLHPLNYARGLARAARAAGAVLHENSRATHFDAQTGRVSTAHGAVEAQFVIVACDAYLSRLSHHLASYTLPLQSHIIATEPLGERARAIIRDDIAVADTRYVVNYYRLSEDGRLLFGGREGYGDRPIQDIAPAVRRRMLSVFPQLHEARIDYAWGGAVAITANRMPHIGRLGKRAFFAQGYSGHGVAMAGFAGALIAEAITGTAERFDVFARLNIPPFTSRAFLRGPLAALALLYGRVRDAL